ncbi:MAG: hypothetical protein ACLPVF_00420 [Acidimicrobiales bacterium]
MSLSSATLVHEGYPEAFEAYFEGGFTDGLPVIPPTPEAVEAMLAASGLRGDEVLGGVPTRNLTVSAEKAAINAVMAGCRPEYFPVVVASVRALLQPLANCHSTTATLAGAAHAVIVNGPVRGQLGIASGQACMGPGFRANATIGRALRLVVRNVCRTVPGVLDRASFSWPLRYSFCFGENEECSDWTPLHVLQGYAPEDSAVTVMSVLRLLQASEFAPDAESILETISETARLYGMPIDEFVGDARGIVVVIGTEHHRRFLDEGWTKEAVRQSLFERMTKPTARKYDQQVMVADPANIVVVAAGGPGMAQSQVIMPHLAAPTHERVS